MGLEVYHRAKVRYGFKQFEIAKSHIGPAPLISLALNMHLMRIILFPQIFDISISNCLSQGGSSGLFKCGKGTTYEVGRS